MTLHHVNIYHCQRCGRVVSREHGDRLPSCCQLVMKAAVANITYEDDCDDIRSTEEVIAKSHSRDSCR